MSSMKRAALGLSTALAFTLFASSTALAAAQETGAATALSGLSLSPLQASLASGSTPYDREAAVFTGKGISDARAQQALDVQSKVTNADIVRKVEAGAGGAFGGAWFDAAAAQLHVGVTSPAARQAAEAAIAAEGLADEVVVTPVRSTAAELLAAQEAWGRRLATLPAGPGASTGIEPQRNAVVVKLGSSVPAAEVAALRRQAAADEVNVLVSVAGGPGFKPLAKTECKTWKTSEAYCNPSITSGVSILGAECKEEAAEFAGGFVSQEQCENRNVAGTKGKWRRISRLCTVGPLALKGKERVMLTAGHCVGAEKEGEWSRNKAAAEEKRVGRVGLFSHGGTTEATAGGDYAEASIEAAWQTGKPEHPVFAVTAEWKRMNAKKEETSYPVVNEKTPVVGMTSCHVGQTSGESCGEIKAVNVKTSYTVLGVKRFFNGLVEVVETKKETLENKSGDSGGPELTIIEPSGEARMEGMDVAGSAECGELKETRVGPRFYATKANCEEEEKFGEGKFEERTIRMLFQPLKSVEKGPEGALEKMKLELLTTANE
ncbi:MAG TPA: hypothetical protein VL988_05135 [Solirubrobacteraceae bacterium]|nr:hypothetical protein [Solirubrobacteraceae bacterium]